MKVFMIAFLVAIFFFTSNSQAIKDPSLVFYLNFEEGSGATTTDQISKIKGDLKNGAKWSPDGKIKKCLLLEQPAQYVEFPAAPELDIVDQITIEEWIFPEQSQGDSDILGRRNAGNVGGYTIQWSAQFTGKPQIETWITVNAGGNWQGTRQKQKIAPELKKWHHIASTYDGKKIRQYIDGELDVEFDAAGKINSVKEVFRVGQAQTNLESMIGRIDEVAIYKKALTQDEIKTDMSQGVIADVSPIGNLLTIWGTIKNR